MSLGLLGVLLLVAVIFSAWRRSAWMTAALALCLGVVIAGSGGPLGDLVALLLDAIRALTGTFAKTLF